MHRSGALLKTALLDAAMLAGVAPGDRFRHYAGEEVEIVTLAYRECDCEPMVCYRALTDGLCWMRALSEFVNMVNIEGGQVRRFAPMARAG